MTTEKYWSILMKVVMAAKRYMNGTMLRDIFSVNFKVLSLIFGVFLASCASTSDRPGQAASPHQKIGAPYRINGRLYKPAADSDYNKVGIASWYGDQFHGRLTANGEIFDKNRISAAHTTLPMPSLVEVKNLENGRKIVVRLNDRGPFVDDRIIDLSRAAATELGFQSKGLAKVRVKYLGPAPLKQLARKANERPTSYATSQNVASISANSIPIAPANHNPAPQAYNVPSDDLPIPHSDPIAALIEAQPATPRLAPQHETPLPVPSLNVTQASVAHSIPLEIDETRRHDNGLGYWIDAGIFSHQADATNAQNELAHIGPSKIIEMAVAGTHQLRIGPYVDRMDALAQLARIVERGYSSARIVEPIIY